MKKIGLIAGMSWQSSLEYYRLINEMVNKKKGGLNSAEVFMNSLNFAEISDFMDNDNWEEISWILAQAGNELEFVGAEIILLCSNTVHYAIPEIAKHTSTRFLHIADTAADKVLSSGISSVGLLGTKFTMKQDFYKKSLKSSGLEVFVPEKDDMDFINHVIFDELCLGVINPESKKRFVLIIESLVERGAQGIVLGCTEIPLLVKQGDVSIPLFDTMKIHVEAAVELALK